jgi:spoIIIJ-associated protein
MNPYERRIIHSVLQNDRYVETHSEGEEPYRRVVVTLKKDAPRDNRRYNGRNGSNSRYGNRNSGYKKNNYYGNNRKKTYPKYNDNSDDYSKDYKADYAAYLESKAAAKAAAESDK